jgi:uncharacterized protein (DUF2147 family)
MLIMKKIYLKSFLILLFLNIVFFSPLHAHNNINPVGLWRTYDLQGKARSVLKFYVVNNELRADVVKILLYAGERCVKCTGENKDKPFLNMTIIQGLNQKGDKWINGTVLDTDSGRTYGCNITLSNDGKVMHFHAYKGLPLFGRTVRWIREE